MNTNESAPFMRERGQNGKSQEGRLDDLGADSLDRSGFESEVPDRDFEERS